MKNLLAKYSYLSNDVKEDITSYFVHQINDWNRDKYGEVFEGHLNIDISDEYKSAIWLPHVLHLVPTMINWCKTLKECFTMSRKQVK